MHCSRAEKIDASRWIDGSRSGESDVACLPIPALNVSLNAWLKASLAIIAALALTAARPAAAELTIKDPGTFVVDTANVLDGATARELEGWLKQLEIETTAQVKLLIVRSLEGDDLFEFSQRTYVAWKLGLKKEKNGALIVLAIKDHKVRIHTGYGLEGALPDSWCGTLIRRVASDYFRRGAYAEGCRELVVAVVRKVAAEDGKTIANTLPRSVAPFEQVTTVSPLVLVVILLVVFGLVALGLRRGWISRDPGGSFFSSGRGGGWSGGGGGWSSGGGWGGGDAGGSFGGGGDSGGGGASASW